MPEVGDGQPSVAAGSGGGEGPQKGALASAYPAVDQVFADACVRHRIPGVAYGVVFDGELSHAGGCGVRDSGTGAPVLTDTIFRIASMTKSVTATCLLMLRDDGLLALDDPVAKYVPQLLKLNLPTRDSVAPTVRQLLTMSVGFVEDDPWADRHLSMSEAEFDTLLERGIPFDWPSGLVFEYSNLGYGVVGRVVREVAGSSLMELASNRLFEPLGMSDTVWETTQVASDRVARGYRLEGEAWVEEPPLPSGAFAPMGGLWTTIEDFAQYVNLQLSAWPARDDPDPGPLRRSSLREMQQPVRFCPAPDAKSPWLPMAGYGFGLIAGESARDGRVVCHSGGLPGFGSHVQWLPDYGLGVFAFANLTYSPMRIVVGEAIDALVASKALVPRTIQPSAPLAAAWQAVRRLYDSWDDRIASELAADNLFLDVPADRRREEFQRLRAEHGACLDVQQSSASGAMRGTWRLNCERGAIDLTIWLAPTSPPAVQVLRVVSVSAEETPGGS
ncbi:MAG: serine hydrolase domain-containing protein [Candidatus Dormiibacterota bacterium]